MDLAMRAELRTVDTANVGRIVVGSTSPRAYSEEPGMLRSRVWLATCLVLACAACSGQGAAQDPPSTPSSSTSNPTAPTSSVPPELAGYSEQERAAYTKAVAEYDVFIGRNDEFYATGKSTVAAKNFYQRFAVDWSTAWANLAQVANNGVTVSGSTKTLWTRPKDIALDGGNGDVVVLLRCLDESGRVVIQHGERLDQPQFEEPHVYTVRVEKRPGEGWWRSGIAHQGQTC